MKTLFLAAAAVLAIGAGSAFAETGEIYNWDQRSVDQGTGTVVHSSMSTMQQGQPGTSRAAVPRGNG